MTQSDTEPGKEHEEDLDLLHSASYGVLRDLEKTRATALAEILSNIPIYVAGGSAVITAAVTQDPSALSAGAPHLISAAATVFVLKPLFDQATREENYYRVLRTATHELRKHARPELVKEVVRRLKLVPRQYDGEDEKLTDSDRATIRAMLVHRKQKENRLKYAHTYLEDEEEKPLFDPTIIKNTAKDTATELLHLLDPRNPEENLLGLARTFHLATVHAIMSRMRSATDYASMDANTEIIVTRIHALSNQIRSNLGLPLFNEEIKPGDEGYEELRHADIEAIRASEPPSIEALSQEIAHQEAGYTRATKRDRSAVTMTGAASLLILLEGQHIVHEATSGHQPSSIGLSLLGFSALASCLAIKKGLDRHADEQYRKAIREFNIHTLKHWRERLIAHEMAIVANADLDMEEIMGELGDEIPPHAVEFARA